MQPEQLTEVHIKRLKKLYELSMTLSGDPIDIFQRVSLMIGELLDVRVVCLSEIRGDELYFISVFIDGKVMTDVGNCPLSITPCFTVKQSKDIRVFDNVTERFPEASFLKTHNAFSYCGFPSLDSNGEVIAVTCLLDDKPHKFTQQDQELLQIFGQRIALEMERQRVLNERKQAEKMLRSLVNSTVGVTGTECFNAVASELCNYFGVDCAIVGEIVDKEAVNGEKIRALAMILDGQVVPRFEYTLKESPCENVTEKGYCFYSHDICKLFPNDRDLIDMNAEGYVGTPIRDKTGRAIGVLCAISRNRIEEHNEWKDVINILASRASAEISRKRAEEKALHFNRVFERSLNEIYIFDAETLGFVEVNRGARVNLGYTMEELRGLTALDLKPEFTPELFAKLVEPLRAGNQEKVQFTTVHRRKDGSQYPVEVHLQLMTDGIPVFVAIILDITERKKLEEETQKIHKLESIGIFAGGIAHDFNNILAGILNNVYLSKMNIDRESKEYKSLESAEKAIYRATNLTQQLLTFSRGGVPIKKTSSIIELIEESTEFALKGSNVKCEYIVADDLWPVEVDEGQMNQVIHNLILNAYQAMPEGGTIRIHAENIDLSSDSGLLLKEGRCLKIVIQDQGIGIEKEQLKKIFDPYFTTKEMGQGLGLSITYSIIKQHNGLLTVESEKGTGTTFTIYLPASEKQVEEKESVEHAPVAGEGKILIMDDEEIIRESLGELLTMIGYEVEYAKDGEEAIELYKETMESSKPFDAAILDLTIRGGMGGKEVINKLREIDLNLKAIVSSGYSNDPVMANFREYGFSDVLTKPWKSHEELSEILHKVINE